MIQRIVLCWHRMNGRTIEPIFNRSSHKPRMNIVIFLLSVILKHIYVQLKCKKTRITERIKN